MELEMHFSNTAVTPPPLLFFNLREPPELSYVLMSDNRGHRTGDRLSRLPEWAEQMRWSSGCSSLLRVQGPRPSSRALLDGRTVALSWMGPRCPQMYGHNNHVHWEAVACCDLLTV